MLVFIYFILFFRISRILRVIIPKNTQTISEFLEYCGFYYCRLFFYLLTFLPLYYKLLRTLATRAILVTVNFLGATDDCCCRHSEITESWPFGIFVVSRSDVKGLNVWENFRELEPSYVTTCGGHPVFLELKEINKYSGVVRVFIRTSRLRCYKELWRSQDLSIMNIPKAGQKQVMTDFCQKRFQIFNWQKGKLNIYFYAF